MKSTKKLPCTLIKYEEIKRASPIPLQSFLRHLTIVTRDKRLIKKTKRQKKKQIIIITKEKKRGSKNRRFWIYNFMKVLYIFRRKKKSIGFRHNKIKIPEEQFKIFFR